MDWSRVGTELWIWAGIFFLLLVISMTMLIRDGLQRRRERRARIAVKWLRSIAASNVTQLYDP